MSKENVRGVRLITPGAHGGTGYQIELVPEEGTTIAEPVHTYARQWGVHSVAELDEAEKWHHAVEALRAGRLDQADYERGENPNRNEEFRHPRDR